MHRVLLATALVVASLFAVSGVATAQPPAEKTIPPIFTPPAPAPVVDEASAEAAARRYAARNAGRFLQRGPRRVRVLDVNARCLEHPIIADRFGCVFTLRALVRRDRRDWGHDWDGPKAAQNKFRRVRVRTFGCLGLLRIVGGPTVTPSITVPLVECARAPRGDYEAPEPVA
jgi:hypothetical protein